ncbi:Uma2 family endonuclease [Methylobacterium sp. WSM2598]|uniref:Uma2 family endonuclease n=1 Tax=Methylobacterium sp. WSM2598 TaxID=398261 RepID=UPI0003604CAF|nr:Uma2 family endonuclease [Methylobacterium sp. WSM2598]
MADAAHRFPALTIADCDAFVAAQRDEREWELVAGEFVMMSNPTEDHEQIAGNIGAPLKLAMDAAGCRSYQGGMRVQRSDDGRGRDKTRPDIVVRLGPRQNQTYVTDPLVVVEVLSPSTMDHDCGGKLAFHKSLPTLRHLALVYQDQMRVEHYQRTEEGWRLEVLITPQDVLRFDAVDFEIDLDRIYFGVPVSRPLARSGPDLRAARADAQTASAPDATPGRPLGGMAAGVSGEG